MTTKICYFISFLTGIGLLFIGTRFLLSPLQAAFDYGMLTNTKGNFSFHYVKGIRDIFSGLLLLLLVLMKERRALAIVLLAATIVPLGDFIVVLGERGNDWQFTIAHLLAIGICIILGSILLMRKKGRQATAPEMSFRIIQSAETGGSTITECDLLPGAKTPWHYHTLFSEKFELLVGNLEVGRNSVIYQLKEEDEITILPNEPHLFNNRSTEKCRVRTVLTPGNIQFEQASRILLGLTNDGLTKANGIPRNLFDLALFLYLNNSKMMGFLKIFQPIFSLIAKIAIKRGRLAVLLSKYCKID